MSENKIKCIVWDLDNTLWDGILTEDENVDLNEDIMEIIKTMDERGILHSIASKNNYYSTMNKLIQLGIDEYFLYPQICWEAKSISIKKIVESLNIGIDTIALVDDQEYELKEVEFSHPEVMCISVQNVKDLIDMVEFQPTYITEDSKNRRKLYQDIKKRQDLEDAYQGPQLDFLKTLNMVFTIKEARLDDLHRAEELTIRTNQLNSTGITYGYEELRGFMESDEYKLYVCSLEDKFGSYGKIGLTVIKMNEFSWTIKLLLSSCRVISRGVGSIMLNYIIQESQNEGVDLLSDFIHNDRNKMMYVAYKMAGFIEISSEDMDHIILQHGRELNPVFPRYVEIVVQ